MKLWGSGTLLFQNKRHILVDWAYTRHPLTVSPPPPNMMSAYFAFFLRKKYYVIWFSLGSDDWFLISFIAYCYISFCVLIIHKYRILSYFLFLIGFVQNRWNSVHNFCLANPEWCPLQELLSQRHSPTTPSSPHQSNYNMSNIGQEKSCDFFWPPCLSVK